MGQECLHITINGAPGSGKSSAALILAELLDRPYYSAGDFHREIALERSRSELELNYDAEVDEGIDALIDTRTKLLGEGPPAVFDARMAWFVLNNAITVHLICSDRERLQRVALRRRGTQSLADAQVRARKERQRFRSRYGVDIAELSIYDLVVDTTGIDAHKVAATVAWIAAGGRQAEGTMWLARKFEDNAKPPPESAVKGVSLELVERSEVEVLVSQESSLGSQDRE